MISIPQKLEDKYKQGAYPFPSDLLDPALKTKDWARQVQECQFRDWLNDQTAIPYSKRLDYVTYRLYAEGRQPTQKYMDRLSPKDLKGMGRKGYTNFSWDIFPVMPSIESTFLGMFDQVEHDVLADATDENSQTAKEKAKWDMWAEMLLESFYAENNLQSNTGQMPVKPKNVEQLELFMSLSFKLQKEIIIETFLKKGFFNYINWGELKKGLLTDLFRLGIAATKDYVQNDKVMGRYVDPANLIVSYSNRNTFDNIDKVAEIVPYRISTLRPLLYEAGYTEDDVKTIALQYVGILGNANQIDTNNYYYLQGIPQWRYDDWKILVMESEWDSDDVYYYESNTDKQGKKVSRQVDKDYKTKSTKKKVEQEAIHVVYQSKWVVGTNMIFDFGKLDTMPRETSGNGKYRDVAKKSFHIYKVTDNSICARCISQLDDIQLTVVKYRNAKAMAAPKGTIWELSTIENLTIGGKKMSPFDMMTIRRHTGDGVYRATTHHSQVIAPSAMRPFFEMEGGVGGQQAEWLLDIDFNMRYILRSIGIDPTSAGQTPNPDMLVGVQEALTASTNNALQPIYSAYAYLKQETAKNAVNRLLVLADEGRLDKYIGLLGDVGVSVLEISKELKQSCFALQMQLRPTRERKQFVRELALAATKVPLEQGGISAADFFQVDNMIEDGNLKLAQAVLAYKEQQNKERVAKLQQENIQLQQKATQETEQAKVQLQQQMDAMKYQAEIDMENVKSKNKKDEIWIQHLAKMKEIELANSIQASAKVQSSEIAKEGQVIKVHGDIVKESMKEEKKAESTAA